MMTFSHSELLFQRAQARICRRGQQSGSSLWLGRRNASDDRKSKRCLPGRCRRQPVLGLCGSWGPMLLGHNHAAIKEAVIHAVENGLSFGAATELEVTMAELLCSLVPSLDMVRMVNSGTEAVMSAIRLARGYTQKDKIIKFEGCYHGLLRIPCLVKAGSGVMTCRSTGQRWCTQGLCGGYPDCHL